MRLYDVRKGMIVRIYHAMHIIRMDKYQICASGDLRDAKYKVIFVESHENMVDPSTGESMHDIHIKSMVTGAIYLHSAQYIEEIVEYKHKIISLERMMEGLLAHGYQPMQKESVWVDAYRNYITHEMLTLAGKSIDNSEVMKWPEWCIEKVKKQY